MSERRNEGMTEKAPNCEGHAGDRCAFTLQRMSEFHRGSGIFVLSYLLAVGDKLDVSPGLIDTKSSRSGACTNAVLCETSL